MKKSILLTCIALASCNAVTTTNNALANLVGGANASGVAAACAIVDVAEGYFANVKQNVTPTEAQAEAAAEAVVNKLCTTPPTNITVLFSDLLSAWTVIQAATTVPTTTNPNPSVPPLTVTPTSN